MSKPLLWELVLALGSLVHEAQVVNICPSCFLSLQPGLGLINTNSSEELGKGTAGTACEFNSARNVGCLTSSQLLFFVVQVEDAKFFLNEKISASSEVSCGLLCFS